MRPASLAALFWLVTSWVAAASPLPPPLWRGAAGDAHLAAGSSQERAILRTQRLDRSPPAAARDTRAPSWVVPPVITLPGASAGIRIAIDFPRATLRWLAHPHSHGARGPPFPLS